MSGDGVRIVRERDLGQIKTPFTDSNYGLKSVLGFHINRRENGILSLGFSCPNAIPFVWLKTPNGRIWVLEERGRQGTEGMWFVVFV
jgi:hypothetical protein